MKKRKIPMIRETIVILGIPVDNLDMDETVEGIFALIDASRKDGKARLVATVNVDFVVNTLTWRLSRLRHPELIDILRRADLVTPDGMPLIWTSRMLGTPLKERVTGADLVPRLAEAAARKGKSIYFLGGQGDVGSRAARLLQAQFPGLKVAGADSPFVRIEGEALTGEAVNDQAVVERINRSGADILLIGFGNPKQEVWFERNRSRLQVPVSIGIRRNLRIYSRYGGPGAAMDAKGRIGMDFPDHPGSEATVETLFCRLFQVRGDDPAGDCLLQA
jgi:N-acetylglucosaminyldiphosphoundecaprenol N-acetyl-beta-D-mannosaminyltransferase